MSTNQSIKHPKSLGLGAVKNILLIRLSSLGDIVLTSPAIRAVRQHFPQAHISMLVGKQFADLLTENPHLDEVIPFDRKAGNRNTGQMRRMIRLLRERRFDLVIDFQRKFRTSLLGYQSGAGCRVGYHQPNGVLCTVRVPDRSNRAVRAGRISSAPAIDRYFTLLHAIGVEATDRTLELFVADTDRAFSHELMATNGIAATRPKIGLFPGAAWQLREWMPDRFAAIGDRAAQEFDAQVLLFGGPHEERLVEQVADLMTTEAISLAGTLGLRQLAALIERCDLFLTNDTGPMHIAAAMQTPTVALFGPGDHIRFQPLDPIHTTIRHHVPCNPCKQFTNRCKNNICMKLITVDEVWEAVHQNLSNIGKTASYYQ